MKYQYCYKLTNTNEEVKVTRKELKNLLNQWCTKPVHYINGLGYISATDEKLVDKVLRDITQKNCGGVILSEAIVYARRIEGAR